MTDKIEWLKQELNREMSREGKLQRADLRKCRIILQDMGRHSETAGVDFRVVDKNSLSDLELRCLTDEYSIDGKEGYLESIEEFYFHGASIEGFAIESKNGILFQTNHNLRFTT